MANVSKPVINLSGTDRETVVSIILGAIVVIVIGALAFRYFRNDNVSQPISEDITLPDNEQVVQVEELPSEVVTEETENGQQIPTNLPAKYTVKPGDSSWKIAQAFYGSGFNYVDIEQANNLSPEQELTAGMELTIPRVPVRTANTAAVRGDVSVEEGEMPTDQTGGPSKGNNSEAEAVIGE
jgi:LysM repeat protein